MAKFISYGRQSIDEDDINEVVRTLKSDFLTQGPKAEEFEQNLKRYTGAKYAVAVSNATGALHLGVAALELKKGSQGITSPITFVASSNCLLYNDLEVVFADIDEQTYNIDPKEIEKKITKKTKVLIPVHYAGQAVDMKKLHKIAKAKKLFVIEDAAHAIGSKYLDGTRVGNCKYSDMTVFSFHPVKNITTAEGGAITTNDKTLYEKLLLLRSHGITKDPKVFKKNPGPWYYEMQRLGFNYRMSDLNAALGVSQLKKIEKFKKLRRQIIAKYNQAFGGLSDVVIPYEQPGLESMFHLYTVKIDFKKIGKSRKQVMDELRSKGVGSQVLYIPVYLQPYYKKLGFKAGLCPKAEAFYEKALSLPLFPKMSKEEFNLVEKTFKEVI
jgi:UDP-4-amino-4,6-dideoxy-N-acetyl-beta-L-altrosamine transaminase